MVIFNGSNYEQTLLHIIENVVPEDVSDAEKTLHTVSDRLQRNHEIGWQKKVDCRWTYVPQNRLG